MRKINLLMIFIPALALFLSCHNINSKRTELDIGPSQVYFSFDDGPDNQTTANLLDVLEKYRIKALFCLLGVNAEKYPELVSLIHEKGHIIINHGYSDKWAVNMNNAEFRENLLRGERAISEALGLDMYPKFYRPHGGYYNSSQKKICIDEGYIIVPATVRVYDAVIDKSKHRKVVREIIKKLDSYNGGFILLHDCRDAHHRKEKKLAKNLLGPYDRSWIPNAVEEIITLLLEKRYNLYSEMPLFD